MSKDYFILGLNIYHGDSSAYIMKNGETIFAIEEERINRIKHWVKKLYIKIILYN